MQLERLKPEALVNAPTGDWQDGGGLLLRVRGQSASWVLRYTSPSGRRREMGLGVCDLSAAERVRESVREARAAAAEARRLVRQRVDPIDERDAARKAAAAKDGEAQKRAKDRAYWTLARVARDYHARIIEPARTAKHAAQWIASLENHMGPSVWAKPVADLTAADLLDAIKQATPHERARRGGDLRETKLRMQARLRAVLEDAKFRGLIEENPAVAVHPKLMEGQPLTVIKHLRALPWQDAPALFAQLRTLPGSAPASLAFAMLTAARTSEVLLAEWAEIDARAGVWVIPAPRTKCRREHRVHLSAPALEVLAAQRGLHRRWVFPSAMKFDSPLSNMAMLAVLDRIGMRDRTTAHGLCRATFATWAGETSAARMEVIESALAHRLGDAEHRAYHRGQYLPERAALLDAWAAFLRS